MKKILLLFVSMLVTTAVMAQVTRHHDGFYFDKMSPNGKWMATQEMGNVYIYAQDGDEYFEYASSEDAVTEYYATGIGNCISDDGTIVGGTNDATCAYWKDGEWKALPVKEENTALNLANGITPDGSRIVGQVGNTGLNLYSEQMIKPVYWDRNAEGGYDTYQLLPYPATDFCGRKPQYITAIAVSDDGKTIAGQVVDWSGFYVYPIIYTQDEAGVWSYRTVCEGVLYPEGAQFALWPGEEPLPEEYMTEEELAEYLAAYNEYLKEVDRYNNGETGIYPEEPNPTDYMYEYYNDFTAAVREYYELLAHFDTVFMENMYDATFLFNNVYLSGNGRYYNTTVERLVVTDPMTPYTTSTPTCIDLENGDSMVSVAGATDMIASSAMNDGRTIAQSPKMAYARNSYIVSADGKTLTPFADYIAALDKATGEWLKELSSFEVLVPTEYDEDGYPINYQYVDSVVAGSVYCNSEGTVFGSFMYDEWSEYVTYRQFSYTINLNELEAVEGIENDRELDVYVAEKTLYIKGEAANVTLYDMRGAIIAQYEHASGAIALDVAEGIYLVRCENNNGTRTYKVAVK